MGISFFQLSVENSLFKSFDRIVRMQLDPIWHRTSRRTRALVGDLQTLRHLLTHLVHSDCVTFFEHLECVFDTASAAHPTERPHWVLHSSEEVFLLARERVYQMVRTQATFKKTPAAAPAHPKRQRIQGDSSGANGGTAQTASPAAVANVELSRSVEGPANVQAPLSVSLVLEGCPKWEALQQLLTELRVEQRERNEAEEALPSDATPRGATPRGAAATTAQRGCTLLVVRDERAARTLKALLAYGARAVLEANLIKWVSRRRRSSLAGGAVLSARQHEAKLLRQAAERITARHESQPTRPHALPPLPQEQPGASLVSAQAYERGGGGGKGGGNSGGRGGGGQSAAESARAAKEGGRGRGRGRGRGEGRGKKKGSKKAAESAADTNEGEGEADEDGETRGVGRFHDEQTPLWEVLPDESLELVIATHQAAGLSLLAQLQPRSVILYDPEPTWVRCLEVEQARRVSAGAAQAPAGGEAGGEADGEAGGEAGGEAPVDVDLAADAQPTEHLLHIYFLMLRDSVDEQRYRTALQQEKEAFEGLIFAKGHMALPQDWDGKGIQMPEHLRLGAFEAKGNAKTRRFGGQVVKPKEPPSVVIDMREFRSALPNLLHMNGVKVHAMTLEVGDYVLSPDLCVERKSLQDLTQSLASGRLYNQAENMLRFYKRPAMLIEFDEGRQFALVNPSEIGPEISPNSLMSKLALLIIHFPRLRLLWSRRPLHTVSIFAALKENAYEPDPQVAAALGNPEAGVGQVVNMTPQDILRSMPGVYPHNYRRLMNAFENLQQLSEQSCERLSDVIGPSNGKKLHEFLNRTA